MAVNYRRFTDDEKEEMARLRRKGKSYAEIAGAVGGATSKRVADWFRSIRFLRVRTGALALALALALGFPAWAAETINPRVSAAAESNHVFCDATGSVAKKVPCLLRSMYVTTGASAGFLMTFNALTAPDDGAVTPIECVSIPATTTISLDFGDRANPYATGLVAVFSTTGCFTKTASATAFFKGQVQ